MIVFASILVMLAAAVVLLASARSLRLPYPALLALAGAAVGDAPIDTIGLRLDSELALALLIAPVLLDAAYDTSLRDTVPVASLARIAVGLTTAASHWWLALRVDPLEMKKPRNEAPVETDECRPS